MHAKYELQIATELLLENENNINMNMFIDNDIMRTVHPVNDTLMWATGEEEFSLILINDYVLYYEYEYNVNDIQLRVKLVRV
jgi:flagellar assembly factor FliW